MLALELKPTIQQISFFRRKLEVGHLVTFSKLWKPENIGIKPGATYRVAQAQQVKRFVVRILPSTNNDYVDIDLSNADRAEKLFPASSDSLYQHFIGLKGGNYFIHLHSPERQFIYHYEYTGQFYDPLDPVKRYIGAIFPYQSPVDDPRIELFCVMNMTPFFIRIHPEGVPYEKCVLVFFTNWCWLKEIPSPTREQLERARYIPYIDEVAMRVRVD